MIDLVILCPVNVEYNAIRKHLNHLSFEKEPNFHLSYERGVIQESTKKWIVAIFETGSKIGNLQARTTQILHSLKPKFVFLMGIAAGIKDVRIGDIIIGTKAYGYESGKETDEGFLIRPDVIHSSRSLIELSKQLIRENPPSEFKVEFGAIAAGNRIINTDKESLQIIKRSYNDTKAIEMESIGFGIAAQEANIPFLNIRCICDLATEKNDDYQELAANRAAEFTVKLIKRLPISDSKKAIQNIPVYYTQEPYTSVSWRRNKTTILHIFDSELSFVVENQQIKISNIQNIEHYKMKGDFAKNWVKIQTVNKEYYYFATQSFLAGWGSIFGGNKQLLNNLKRAFSIS